MKKCLHDLYNHYFYKNRVLIILLFISIGMGLILSDDYGMSWDEPKDIINGQESLKAYYDTPNFQITNPAGPTGPFSFMVTDIGSRLFTILFPHWLPIDGRHFTYFIIFLVGAASLYSICKRLVNRASSEIITILYITQPLFWGHAFINPKDIPFMSFFMATIALGIAMVDEFLETRPKPSVDKRIISSTQVRLQIKHQ